MNEKHSSLHHIASLLGVFSIALCAFVFVPSSAYADTLYSNVGAGGECCTVDGASGISEMYSQTFSTASDYDLTTADLWAASQGGSDNLVIRIYNVSGGYPTGSPLFSSSNGSGWTTGALNSVSVSFSSACLASGSYAFTIERTGSRDTSNNFVVGRSAGAGMGVRNSSVWSSSGSYNLKSAIYGTPATCSSGPEGDGSLTGTSTTAIATTTEDLMYVQNTFLAYFFGICILLLSFGVTMYIWSTLKT